MQKLFLFFCSIFCILQGCEEVITLELPADSSKIVIVGEISNRNKQHEVHVFRTIPLQSATVAQPVSLATVRVFDNRGRTYDYFEEEPGIYRSRRFLGQVGLTYQLTVEVDNQSYSATSVMPEQVKLDSLGISVGVFFDRSNRFITAKFQDPPGKTNYYRYLMKVNGSDWKYLNVFSDVYNDGKFVVHELLNFEVTLNPEDQVILQHQMIDQATYEYWRSYSAAHPAAASPSNPISNLSNGALGYFSAYSFLDYDLIIPY